MAGSPHQSWPLSPGAGEIGAVLGYGVSLPSVRRVVVHAAPRLLVRCCPVGSEDPRELYLWGSRVWRGKSRQLPLEQLWRWRDLASCPRPRPRPQPSPELPVAPRQALGQDGAGGLGWDSQQERGLQRRDGVQRGLGCCRREQQLSGISQRTSAGAGKWPTSTEPLAAGPGTWLTPAGPESVPEPRVLLSGPRLCQNIPRSPGPGGSHPPLPTLSPPAGHSCN